MPRPFPAGAEPHGLERTYLFERALADRLRQAPASSRAEVYAEVYGEYSRELGPAVVDPGSLDLQASLLEPWLAPSMVFAEVGAGSGALARRIAGRVGRMIAVEAVVPTAEEVSSDSRLEWTRHDQTETRIADQSVDLAFSCHVLEHLHPDDVFAHFAEVLRWLRPGSPYLMVTPNRLCGPHDISGFFADEPEGFHLREYTHRELATEARRAGFTKLSAADSRGRRRALWPRILMELALGAAGQGFRRWLFDGFTPIARRAPLRPLEQVSLAAFKPAHL